jgi:hypothetical protein
MSYGNVFFFSINDVEKNISIENELYCIPTFLCFNEFPNIYFTKKKGNTVNYW